MHELGFIHGRFQVLHNDHLRYLLAGKAECRHLVVGITNPDPMLTQAEEADPARSDPSSNPLTYWERYQMVREVLNHAGVRAEEFSITPFPVTLPRLYKYYAPLDALFFLTIYDAWGLAKLKRFKDMGLNTQVLWERSPEMKGISGKQVRELIRSGGAWKHLVPDPVPELLEAWNLRDRL